jgi:hypothetical protein
MSQAEAEAEAEVAGSSSRTPEATVVPSVSNAVSRPQAVPAPAPPNLSGQFICYSTTRHD